AVGYATQIFVFLPFLKRELGVHRSDLSGIVLPLLVGSLVATCLGSVAMPQDADPSWYSLLVRGIITASTLTVVHGLLTSFRIVREAGDVMVSVLRKTAPDLAK